MQTAQTPAFLRRAMHCAGGDYFTDVLERREGVTSEAVGQDIMRLELLGAALASFVKVISAAACGSNFVDARPDQRELVDLIADAIDGQFDSAALEIVRAAARVEVA